ncbi:MAG TPA: nitrilase-related carbon-nitrogen hydrolase, partial [Candidatus Ozemobacteraceae bacterium]|nr:nitrilase-related carbon-nitrogen hydrolase [Candidatus Ozemobacteraceae bacterium]
MKSSNQRRAITKSGNRSPIRTASTLMKTRHEPSVSAPPPLEGFLRVAATVPALSLGNIEANLREHLEICRHAAAEEARLLVFPELSLTGYSLGDLLLQPEVHETAWSALLRLAHETRNLQLTIVVGLPLAL